MRVRAVMAGLLAATMSCGGDPSTEVDGGLPDDGGADALADGFVLVGCDPVAQQGCEAGEKCSIVPSQTYGAPSHIGCAADTGTLAMMEVCEPASYATPDDCQGGLVCIGTSAPRCLPFCGIFPVDTCDDGQVCAFSDDLDGDLLVDVRFCALTCDVLVQDCDDPDLGCYPTREASVCAPEGAGGTPAQAGETCLHANSCAAGLGCFQIGLSLDWLCLQICDPDDGVPGCDGAKVCNPVEAEPWGVCIDES